VQGIGFRWFVREQAKTLGLAGWVRNLATGGVEVAATGPAAALADFLEAVRGGPPGANVSQVVELPPVDPHSLTTPFLIMR
jgi:acylphosphatase